MYLILVSFTRSLEVFCPYIFFELSSFLASFQVCKNIARKHSKSVDFPKTGSPPDPLVKTWKKTENDVSIPPEKPERWPDFMCKNHEPFYASRRLVGQLFRYYCSIAFIQVQCFILHNLSAY